VARRPTADAYPGPPRRALILCRRVARGLGAGDILLPHDSDRYGASGSYKRTRRALPAIAHALQRSGLGTRLLPFADEAEARSWS
jgi:hypothetical protein